LNERNTLFNMKRTFLLFAALMMASCGIKQPVENIEQQKTGKIFVVSQPDSALIFLDGENTFQYTPDTLKGIAPGRHIIHVQREGFKPLQDSIAVQVREDSVANVMFTLEKLVYLGTLVVNSEPAGAEIYLDGQNTGRYAPDTLQLAPGTYQITLVKNGFVPVDSSITIENNATTSLTRSLSILQRVVLESFGNVSCEPCVTSAENLEKFRSEHAEPSYVLFEYYANWPSPNDPFYNVSPKDVDERVRYYKVYTLPKLRLNGETGVDAASYEAIQTAYAEAIARQNTPLALSASKRLQNDSLYVRVEIYDYGQVLQNTDLRLFVLVYEDDIHFDSPPGSNGLKDFNFVFRTFLSDRTGDLVNANTFTYAIEWSNWQYANCHIVAFLQDVATQKIYQATYN